jgi:hypothetical protein
VAVIRFALDLTDAEALRLAIELCEYGKHLSPQFKYRADPPFDDVYVDHAPISARWPAKTWTHAFNISLRKCAKPIQA